MKKVTGLLSLVIVVGVIITSLAYIFGYVVPPGSLGVRQILVGPDQGFQENGLTPGYYGSIPFRSKVHLIPQTVQTIPIDKATSNTANSKSGSFDITTADGAYVRLAVAALVQFYELPGTKENPHGGPADLIERVGLSPENWKRQIVTTCSDKLTRALSSLRASQFYDPFSREKALTEAEDQIRDVLKTYGIKLERILLDHYTYIDSKIDEAIFRKNIQSQEEKLNEQGSKLSEARAKLEQVSAELDAKIESLRVEGTNRALVLRSEAALYEKQKQAEGDLEYAKAQAEVDKLKAQLLTQSQNAEVYVAREMAPIVASIQGGIVQESDPYDLEAWLKRLGVVK